MLASVIITTLETAGDLSLSGGDITPSQRIAGTDITAGRLVFTPAPDAHGSPYATFRFRVSDGTDDSASGLHHDRERGVGKRRAHREKPDTGPDGAGRCRHFSYTFPENTFGDTEGRHFGHTPSTQARRRTSLPGWLTFNRDSRNFSGTTGRER